MKKSPSWDGLKVKETVSKDLREQKTIKTMEILLFPFASSQYYITGTY